MKKILNNKKAFYEYNIEQKYTVGIVLKGTEVKSIRKHDVSFVGSFCMFIKNELFIRNLHIKEYVNGGFTNHIPDGQRKLLLTKKELAKLKKFSEIKGNTILPLMLFFNDKNLVKLEIGAARGKNLFDKRETLKQKQDKREVDKLIKRNLST